MYCDDRLEHPPVNTLQGAFDLLFLLENEADRRRPGRINSKFTLISDSIKGHWGRQSVTGICFETNSAGPAAPTANVSERLGQIYSICAVCPFDRFSEN